MKTNWDSQRKPATRWISATLEKDIHVYKKKKKGCK